MEFQEASIKQYCERYNMKLVALFKDNGQCSDNFDRPDYIALETFIKKHRGTVSYLVVMAHDRFSRNLPEALMKIKMLEDKYGLKVLASDESPDIDSRDPDVFLNRAFKYLMANSELLRIRQRTSRSIRQALEGGRFVNKAPYGYTNQKKEGQKRVIVIDEEKAVIIRKIFHDFLFGKTVQQIHKEAKAIGYTAASKSAIPRVLSNPVYGGLIRLPETATAPEKFIKGIHQGIVSEANYWRCQELLGNLRHKKTVPDEKVPLRGILKHSCGAHMTAGFSKGKKRYYLYYRCDSCKRVNINGEVLHRNIEEIFDYLNLSESKLDKLIHLIKSKLRESLGIREAQTKIKKEELAEINQKIEALEEKLISDNIGSKTYQKWFKKFSIQKAKIESEMSLVNTDKDEVWKKAMSMLPNLTNLSYLYQKASVHQKHAILREVFKGGITVEAGVLGTPFLHPLLSSNALILKEKGLLKIEQPSQNLGKSTACSEIGN